MIPYELIIPSASRPHLLRETLSTLLANVDQPPSRIIVHEDVRDPSSADIRPTIESSLGGTIPFVLGVDSPPIRHGAALHWLYRTARTDFVLYSQDDFAVVRPLPVRACLAAMAEHGLHHVRFNKRDTMGEKNGWKKRDVAFGDVTLTLCDAWYFQTSLCRRARMLAVLDWFSRMRPRTLWEHPEPKLNQAFNGQLPDFNAANVIDTPPPDRYLDQDVRQVVQRTFIFGPIGERQYIEHLGWRIADWRTERSNRTGGIDGP